MQNANPKQVPLLSLVPSDPASAIRPVHPFIQLSIEQLNTIGPDEVGILAEVREAEQRVVREAMVTAKHPTVQDLEILAGEIERSPAEFALRYWRMAWYVKDMDRRLTRVEDDLAGVLAREVL